jgi:hypothetical protein
MPPPWNPPPPPPRANAGVAVRVRIVSARISFRIIGHLLDAAFSFTLLDARSSAGEAEFVGLSSASHPSLIIGRHRKRNLP